MNIDKDSIKVFSKNPLGIIALFLFLIYGMAALVTGVGKFGGYSEFILVTFIVIYPFVILFIFYLLVTRHHTKLYAPTDFREDINFMRTLNVQLKDKLDLKEIEKKREELIIETVNKIRTKENSYEKIKHEVTMSIIRNLVLNNSTQILSAVYYSGEGKAKIEFRPDRGYSQIFIDNKLEATYINGYILKEIRELHFKGIIVIIDEDKLLFKVTDFAKPYLKEILEEKREKDRNVFEKLIKDSIVGKN